MTDLLRRYLATALPGATAANLGKVSQAGYDAFVQAPSPERETSPFAHHDRYTDAHGNAFRIGSETEQDVYDRKQRQKAVAERNARDARPVPASYGLSEDTPAKRAASARHAAEVAERIRREQAL